MKKFDKNFIISIIILIIIISSSIYFLTKDDDVINISEEDLYFQEIKQTKENFIEDGNIVIHIEGEVLNTGIITIPYGSRISDAIQEAGGTTDFADVSKVNLAYVLQDSQKVYIPSIYDESNVAYITSGAGDNVLEKSNILININNATLSEFETLPGIGTSTAAKIIDYRNKNGKFKKIEDIMNVSGIGESKFNIIKDCICI